MTAERTDKERRASQLVLEQRVAQLERDINEARREVSNNTAITMSIKRDTEVLIEILAFARKTVRVMIIVGQLLKWASVFGLSIATLFGIYRWIKTGVPYKP